VAGLSQFVLQVWQANNKCDVLVWTDRVMVSRALIPSAFKACDPRLADSKAASPKGTAALVRHH